MCKENFTRIYEVVLIQHDASSMSDVCIFYDENRELAIREMLKYRKKHGFSITTNRGTFSIKNIILRERKSTGGIISEISYCELFDIFGKRKRSD